VEFVDSFWLTLLGASAIVSSLCGLSNRRRLRLVRGLAWLSGYVLGIAMFIALPWRHAGATWLVMAVLGSGLYLIYEVYGYVVGDKNGERTAPRLATVVGGLLAWPIMVPEAVEYLLAELGVLKPAAAPLSSSA
jgi:threonine/homoserine efflux transporter RhtA